MKTNDHGRLYDLRLGLRVYIVWMNGKHLYDFIDATISLPISEKLKFCNALAEKCASARSTEESRVWGK